MTDIIERLRSPEFADVAEKYLMIEAAAEIERLRSVIIRYLEFCTDVGVSPVAPELRPIRDAMRAAIADGQKERP